MSEAVRKALEMFEGMGEHDDFAFRHTFAGFIAALDIRQGDYHVINFTKEGLTVRFGPSHLNDTTKEKLTGEKNFDKEKYTEDMLALLKEAIRDEPYHIEVKNLSADFEKQLEAFSQENPEAQELAKKLIKNLPPVFVFYSKEEEPVASLVLNSFSLSPSHYPEAIRLMERVGRRVFECRKGMVEINLNPRDFGGIRNLEEWREELISWKR